MKSFLTPAGKRLAHPLVHFAILAASGSLAQAEDATKTVLPPGSQQGTVPSAGQKINRLPPAQEPSNVRKQNPPSSLSSSSSSSSTSGTSTATSSTASSFFSNMSAYYSGTYTGSSVVNPLANSLPDTQSNQTTSATKVRFGNQVGLGYRLNSNYRLGFAGGFTQVVDTGANVDDIQFRAGTGSLTKLGPVNVAGEVRYYAPLSQAAQSLESRGTLQLRQNLSMTIGNSRWSTNMLVIESAKILPDYTGRTTFSVYAGPQVTYQLTPKIQLWTLFETSAAHINGQGVIAALDDIEPGLSWDILPNLTFTPYLDLKTATGITLNTTSVNANLTWSFL